MSLIVLLNTRMVGYVLTVEPDDISTLLCKCTCR